MIWRSYSKDMYNMKEFSYLYYNEEPYRTRGNTQIQKADSNTSLQPQRLGEPPYNLMCVQTPVPWAAAPWAQVKACKCLPLKG